MAFRTRIFTEISQAIFGIAIWLTVASALGQIGLSIAGYDPRGLDVLILGSIILVAIFLSIYSIYRYQDQQRKRRVERAPCEHGISGGVTMRLCKTCVQRQTTTEAARQLENDLRRRKEEILGRYNEKLQAEKARLRKSIIPQLDELRALSPQEFENEISRMYRRLGYVVTQTSYSNDGGRDAILQKGPDKYLLECKRYAKDAPSGRPEIQKFHSAIVTDKAVGGFFVSTARFSTAAIEYAKSVPIELIDGTRLQEIMFNSKAGEPQDDSYVTVCRECGSSVRHRLRQPVEQACMNGHVVSPSLTVIEVIGKSGHGRTCVKCGSKMRIVTGRHGKFLGCSRYPACRSTQRYSATQRS